MQRFFKFFRRKKLRRIMPQLIKSFLLTVDEKIWFIYFKKREKII
ncbi:MAG: hypothetical protein ACI9XO_002626 [Paraglaciecola sp.]|jgi:hypothetical protein